MLKQSEKSIPDVSLINDGSFCLQTDLAGTILFASPHLTSFTGKQQHELLGNSFNNIVDEEDTQKLSEIFTLHSFTSGTTIPLLVKGKTGTQTIHFTVQQQQPNGKKANTVLNWNADLPGTDSEKEESWFNKFFYSSNDLLFITDTNGYFKKVNQSLANLLGYQMNDLIGQEILQFVYEEDKQKAQDIINSVIEGNNIKEFEARCHCGDGTVRWLSWSTTFIQEDGLLLASARDVTDKKLAEQALNKKTDELNMIVSSLDDIVLEYDADCRYKKVWYREENIFPVPAQHLIGSTPEKLFEAIPGIAKLFREDLQASFNKREIQSRHFSMELNNEVKWFNSKISPLFNPDGSAKGFTQRITDISENRKVELAIEQKNAQLKAAVQTLEKAEQSSRYQASILENTFDAVTSSDPDFYIRSWNRAAEKLYGIKAEEIIGHRLKDFVTLDYHGTTREALVEELHAKGSWTGEASFTRPSDNKRITFISSITILRNAEGAIADIIAVNKDITDKKLAEQSIQESEERFRQFADAAPVMIWVSDENDNTVYVNKCWEDFTGATTTEIAGNGWLKLVYPDDTHIAIEEYKTYFKNRKPVKLEYRLRNRTGDYRWVVDHAVPRFLEDGTFMGYIGSVLDIHDRKIAEEKIRAQVQVIQDVSDGIISTDMDFKVITFNKAAEDMYGILADDIVGHTMRDVIQHHYLSTTREEALNQLFETDHWEGQFYYDRKDGRRVYMLCSLSIVKDEEEKRIGFAGVHRDITERRQSEEALRISEERYRSVVHALGEGILMQDKNGEIIACNHSAEEILGAGSQKLIGLNPAKVTSFCIHEDGTPFPPEQFPSSITLRTGQSLQNVNMGIQRIDGQLVWISINTEPVYYTTQRIHPDAVVSSFVNITQKKAAEIELQRSQLQLREYSERITNILDSITDGFIAVDRNLHILLWNPAVETITGLKAKDVIGSSIEKVFPDFIGATEYVQYLKAIDDKVTITFQHYISRFHCWFETSVYPFSQGVFFYFRDITERKKQEQLLELEKEVLKLNAETSVSLKASIDFFLEGLEKIYTGMLCSVLTLSDDKTCLHHLSAPSLLAEYSKTIDGTKIGPASGSCGTAMFRKQPVITTDIFNDPLWKDFMHLAEQYQLRACWSFPIINAQDEVLATIAMYFQQPKSPTEKELNTLERVGNLLRIIIENKAAEVKIRLSNERYLLVTKATNDAIWDWDVAFNSLYWGEGFYNLFGHKPGYIDNSFGFWESHIHEEDRERIVAGLNKFIHDNNSQIWEAEYRFRKANDEYALVFDRGFLIFDHAGKIHRMVGSMQDITDKREMEKKLLKQELDKQKLVAQAVVDAQEKERAEIGKELHDNVNQILSTAKLYLDLAKTEDDERLDLINRSTENISDAINEIRGISRSLVPPSVGDLGLIDSVKDLVENIKATRKLHVEFYHEGDIDTLLDEKKKLMLFRIIQEQVNNVLKHADANTLVIELIVDGATIDLTISDDGKGFEMDKVRIKKGVGLSNISSRAELFNGKVNIVTGKDKGCKLNINVPI